MEKWSTSLAQPCYFTRNDKTEGMPIPDLSQLQKHCSSNQAAAVVLRLESHRGEFKFPPASWPVNAQTNRVWAHTANMIWSRAESQLHINKCSDPNLAFADYLPMIVWPAKLYIASQIHSVLQHWLVPIYVSQPVLYRRGWCCWMEWVSIVRLTWR